MRSKFFRSIAVAGLLALAGCSENAGSDLVAQAGELVNPEISSDSEGGELPPNGGTDIFSSDDSTLPGESSPSGGEQFTDESSSSSEENSEQGGFSSDNGQQSSSSESVEGQTYAYGWAKGNPPVPTRGCGKQWNRVKSGSYEFQWSVGKRTIRIDIPDNYDNTKPYRLVFGMQCAGGWAGGVQQEGYYGLKPLDTEKTTIFVAPEGNGNWIPWAEADFKLFDELLADLQGNLCIDSSRVFSTGFSYGSMFSNSLAWYHQDVLRAIAAYETAERNIWLPNPRTYKGIGWMGVLGFDDTRCTPEMGRAARDSILISNSVNGQALYEQAEEAAPGGAHKCYDYKTVEDRFPVRWCTQSGGHIWDHKDPNQSESWVPEATWEFITQF